MKKTNKKKSRYSSPAALFLAKEEYLNKSLREIKL